MYEAKRYLTKYIYVCLGSKIPWTRMYIEKYLTKIYICLGSKIPHGKRRKREKKKEERGNEQMIINLKKKKRGKGKESK